MAPCCTKTKSTASTNDVLPIYHDFYANGREAKTYSSCTFQFKKEELRVQVNTSGALKISGEKPLGGDKAATRSGFYKETRVPRECNIDEVRAKLCDGKLTIIMPTKSAFVERKRELDEREEEMIEIGKLNFAKKTVLSIGFGLMAVTTIGAILLFKPETPCASSAATTNRKV